MTKINARKRAFVTHPDRDDHGTVADSNAPAWTPNELTIDPPDTGMVKVRWFDSADPTQLYWEIRCRASARRSPLNVELSDARIFAWLRRG
jgi:hypothetical protein